MRTIALALLFGFAQAPAFDTASVKPNPSRTCDRDGNLAGGRFVMTCSTLRDLIVFAYPRQDGRVRIDAEITGGPSWINSDRFDVIAKAPAGQGVGVDAANTSGGGATPAVLSAIEGIRRMAQALLTDRFTLTAHHESRPLAAYELRIDRAPGRQLKKVDATPRGFQTLGPGHFVGNAVTLPMLAQFLEMSVSRNVFDRTGLQGTFNLELQYAPENDTNGVSIFTALKEQLGLKLDSVKAPIDVLVIDHADKPTPD